VTAEVNDRRAGQDAEQLRVDTRQRTDHPQLPARGREGAVVAFVQGGGARERERCGRRVAAEQVCFSLGRGGVVGVVAGLREKELTYFNSMVLHEHYFGNLGGNGKRSGALETRLGTDFGAAAWEAQVRASATALGGGSGWVVLVLSLHDGGLRVSQSTNHTQALAFGAPLLVLDMYEHAYAIDYGADHAPYIDAFFKNLAWDAVEARYDRAMKAIAAL